ncbi:unnamed protein product [Protopolystoma xenopodis]|uniref:Uncharacterized protein n=1 Tax=Protopolystoma xenopodis TaxID=117903 RepID=A0A448WVD2_9PLAT|nr:unnamed protein product [Protopolystoma xenopodis]
MLFLVHHHLRNSLRSSFVERIFINPETEAFATKRQTIKPEDTQSNCRNSQSLEGTADLGFYPARNLNSSCADSNLSFVLDDDEVQFHATNDATPALTNNNNNEVNNNNLCLITSPWPSMGRNLPSPSTYLSPPISGKPKKSSYHLPPIHMLSTSNSSSASTPSSLSSRLKDEGQEMALDNRSLEKVKDCSIKKDSCQVPLNELLEDLKSLFIQDSDQPFNENNMLHEFAESELDQ